MKYIVNPALATLTFITSFTAFTHTNWAAIASNGNLNASRVALESRPDRMAGSQIKISQFLDFGNSVTYISSRPIAEDTVEVTWEYSGTRYTFQSKVDSFYIQNEAESRQARGGEREALRKAYEEYRRLGGYRPASTTGTPVGNGMTYISSRPIAENTIEVTWEYRGASYTYQSQVDSFYIQNRLESRQARGSEREALRLAYDEYKQSGGRRPVGTPLSGGITYISSRPVADNMVEVIWDRRGTRYTFRSQVDSFFLQNSSESRQARGGERQALRLAYEQYKKSGYNPTTRVPLSNGITYISSRPVGNNTVEVTWEYRGTPYTYRSRVGSFYLQSEWESRQARNGGETEALRIAYQNTQGQQPKFNCTTREVWSAEKRAWCDSQNNSTNPYNSRDFGNVPGVGKFAVIPTSYSDRYTMREFDAIVNGDRQRWWANCSFDAIGTGDRLAPWNSSTQNIHSFVCTGK